MKQQQLKWVFLALLSVIWGSSFILIKKGLLGLGAYQLGSIRILFTCFFLLIIGFKSIKSIPRTHYKWIAISGFLGTFFPVYLFSLAETEIDSSIASILNSLTPLNTLIFGYFFFKMYFAPKQLLGIIVGLVGTLLLIASGANVNPSQNYWFCLFVLAASICYAFNVNIIKKHLQELSAMSIAVGNFVIISFPAAIVLYISIQYKPIAWDSSTTRQALFYIALLAVFGTGIAKVVFNRLVQISTPIFSSSVTYTIPLVALLWGILDHEKLSIIQAVASCIILVGVYLANRKK